MRLESLFCDLIKISVGEQRLTLPSLTHDDWIYLFQKAQQHAVVGVCIAGIQHLKVQGIYLSNDVY